LSDKHDRNKPDFEHVILIAVYALGAMVLMWAFINFVIMYFE